MVNKLVVYQLVRSFRILVCSVGLFVGAFITVVHAANGKDTKNMVIAFAMTVFFAWRLDLAFRSR